MSAGETKNYPGTGDSRKSHPPKSLYPKKCPLPNEEMKGCVYYADLGMYLVLATEWTWTLWRNLTPGEFSGIREDLVLPAFSFCFRQVTKHMLEFSQGLMRDILTDISVKAHTIYGVTLCKASFSLCSTSGNLTSSSKTRPGSCPS
jgi:hypothetical protein